MRKQLITSVRIGYSYHHFLDSPELVVIGEVYYMRRTRILKRLVCKVLHKVELPIDYQSIEETKEEMHQLLDTYVRKYYNS